MSDRPRCDTCGQFIGRKGATWAHIYDMIGHGLDREIYRCLPCSDRYRPAQSNARPSDGNMNPYQGRMEPQP